MFERSQHTDGCSSWRLVVGLAALTAALAGLASCGDESGSMTGPDDAAVADGAGSVPDAGECTPRRQIECTCPSSSTPGWQRCRSDRTWGPCRCDDTSTDTASPPFDTDTTSLADADGSTFDTDTGAPTDADGGSMPDAACSHRVLQAGADIAPDCVEQIRNGADSVTCEGITFDRVLHAVDDLGMDDSGNNSISGDLASAYGDDTLVAFPPGQYLVTNTLVGNDGVDSFGVVGLGTSRNDVEFVFPDGYHSPMFNIRNGANHFIGNFTWQQTRDRKTGVSNYFLQSDGFRAVNVELAGFNPSDRNDYIGIGMVVAIKDRDGVGKAERFVSTGGGVIYTYPDRRVPIWMGPAHQGEMLFEDLHIEESGSHSIYATRTNGAVRVEGGLFKNNDNTNLRISGDHPNKKAWIKDATIVIDTDQAEHTVSRYQNTRGIRVESTTQFYSGLLIEGVHIVMRSTPNAKGAIAVHRSYGAVTVRDTQIHLGVDGVPAIASQSPQRGKVPSPYDIDLENVRITGPADIGGGAVQINDRDNSSVAESCIDMSAAGQDGVVVSNSNGVAVRDSTVNVDGEAVRFNGPSGTVENLDRQGSCSLDSLPDYEGESCPPK